MTFLQITLGYIVGRFAVAMFILPEYFRGAYFTAYEVLESRFGNSVRRAASVVFLLCRTLADGLRLFLTALALQQALAWDFSLCVLVIAIATGIYATFGGVTSVVKNDCLQIVIYTGGALVAAWLLVQAIPGGVGEILQFGKETGRFHTFDLGSGLTDKYVNFWAGLIGGGVLSLATHGVDHLMVQRYLCASSERKAALALCLSGPLVALQFLLFLLIGVGLACFYGLPGSDSISAPDAAFATFLANETPIGVCGLLLAAVMAAAMSTLSSSVNASAGVFVKDLIEPVRGEMSSKTSLVWLRCATLVFTAFQATVAIGAYQVGLEMSVIGAVLAIAGFSLGILLGLMALGMICGKVGTVPGLVAVLFGFVVGTVVVRSGSISWPWNSLIAASSTFLAGWLLHKLLPPSPEMAPDEIS